MGVIAALEQKGFEPGETSTAAGVRSSTLLRFRACRSLSSSWARDRRPRNSGELRLSVIAVSSRAVARCTGPASTSSSSPACAIARRGKHLLGMGAPGRRPGRGLQAASAVGQGRLYCTYDDLLLRARDPDRPGVAADVLRHERRTHYVNARRTLRKLLEWRIVPVHQRERHTTTDEISFGDNDFLAAQVAVLVDASCSCC
jgi:glutamate 5-kinase